jgi:predicted ABC-type ATPase
VQEIIILAGPNGAGKTTFANEYLPAAEAGLVFVNADEISRELDLAALPRSQRVRKRLDAGGHGIPEDVIRRRYEKSLRYLEEIYKPLVDEWYIWDSLEAEFTLAESWDQA